jgi:hypothetical protein
VTRLPDPFATRSVGAGVSADRMGHTRNLADGQRERWERGAAGERATAALLEPLALAGWVVLHDRRVPGMTANIDHLVASAARLWVLDTKVWRGDIVLLGDGQLWYADSPVRDRIAVVARIADAVRVALARHSELAGLDVRAAGVIHGAHGHDLAAVDGVAMLQLDEVVAQIASEALPTACSGGLLDRLDALFPARVG